MSHICALYREYRHVRDMAAQIPLGVGVQSPVPRGTLTSEAASEGIAAVTIEMRGGHNQSDPHAATEVRDAILNLLRVRGIIAGERVGTTPAFTGMPHRVTAECEGFFIASAGVGQVVKRDDLLGMVQDRDEVRASIDGLVLALSDMRYVFLGDPIALIASPSMEPAPSPTASMHPVRRKW